MSSATLTFVLVAVLALVGVGLYGLLALRNLIKLIVTLQIMVKAILLAFVLAGQLSGEMAMAQSFAITILVADTVVAVIGLALAVQIRRNLGSLDVADLDQLRG